MRAYVGVLLVAVALGGALALHNEVMDDVHVTLGPSCIPVSDPRCQQELRRFGSLDTGYTYSVRPGWVDPLAVVLAVGGIGGGLVMVAQARRRLS
jgi:hypothetical protein